MRRLVVVSSTLFALLCPCGAQAWTWPIDGPVLRPFVFGSDPYAAGQHRGIDVGGDGRRVGARADCGDRLVRRVRSRGRSRADDPHGRRLLRDAPAARLDRRAARRRGRGRRTRRRASARAPTRSRASRTYTWAFGGPSTRRATSTRSRSCPSGPGSCFPHPPPAAAPPPVQPQPAPPPAARRAVRASASGTPLRSPRRQPPPPRRRGARSPSSPRPQPPEDAGGLEVVPRAAAGRRRGARRARRSRAGARSRASGRRARGVRAAGREPGARAGVRKRARPVARVATARAGGAQHARRGSAASGSSPRSRRAPARAPGPVAPAPAGRSCSGSPCRPSLVVAAAAFTVTRKARPIIDGGESLLPDHTHLLRQLDPAHRARLHDDCGGHPRAPSRPARRGHVLPDRDRRACLEGVPGRGGARSRREGVRRPDRRGELAAAAGARRRGAGLLHPDD